MAASEEIMQVECLVAIGDDLWEGTANTHEKERQSESNSYSESFKQRVGAMATAHLCVLFSAQYLCASSSGMSRS